MSVEGQPDNWPALAGGIFSSNPGLNLQPWIAAFASMTGFFKTS